MISPTLTLFELNSLVRETIEQTLTQEYWVEAELSECHENRGHCYMELIQKDESNATPVARASAKCWRTQWVLVRSHFERTTGQRLHAGLKVRLKVYANFHEAYGFSWIVSDIDPTFTLGDMARKRQEIISQLKSEGIFDLQKELALPLFCHRIAVISSQTAAGYGDFVNQLNNNEYGLKFYTRLFPAIMQGEGVEQSIIASLNEIYQSHTTNRLKDARNPESQYDCVVIIRGGGAAADLSGFDTLELAENVVQFPLPVITGIGHDRDECILDMVSHLRVKTPTAAAAFLIDHLKQVLDNLDDAQQRIARFAQQKLYTLNAQFMTLQEALPRLFSVVKTRQEARIDTLYNRLLSMVQQKVISSQADLRQLVQQLPMLLDRRLTSERHRMEILQEKVRALDPALLLRRGYSITLKDGHTVRDAAQLQSGDAIETRLAKGILHSIVN